MEAVLQNVDYTVYDDIHGANILIYIADILWPWRISWRMMVIVMMMVIICLSIERVGWL